MTRMVGPGDAQRETVIRDMRSGRERAYGRVATVEHAQDIKTLRDAGFVPASLGGVDKATARVCGSCGFHGYFKVCGRCGGNCE